MIARPRVFYGGAGRFLWLPFIFNDFRGGGRGGFFFPRFGLTPPAPPPRHYSRHFTDLGYYYVFNDYVDVLLSADWFAGRYVAIHGQAQYDWLDRFIHGTLSYSRQIQLDRPSTNTRIGWNHSQRFNSRTDLN